MARLSDSREVLVLGCGALARELLEIIEASRLDNLRVECLPANLHNRPEQIPQAVRARLEVATGYNRVFVAYGDCGTGGRLDEVLAEFGAERLPGAHCYEFLTGTRDFRGLHEEEIGTLFLTDYLARHFDRLVWRGLGLDRWPELRDDYFGHYKRVLHLAQTNDRARETDARRAARLLGLRYERRYVGYGDLEPELVQISRRPHVVPA